MACSFTNLLIMTLGYSLEKKVQQNKMVKAYSRNLGQHSILARKGTKNFTLPPIPPYSIPFLSVLHQNKALHNFPKRGQRSIVERNIGLECVLRVLIFKSFYGLYFQPLIVNFIIWLATVQNQGKDTH